MKGRPAEWEASALWGLCTCPAPPDVTQDPSCLSEESPQPQMGSGPRIKKISQRHHKKRLMTSKPPPSSPSSKHFMLEAGSQLEERGEDGCYELNTGFNGSQESVFLGTEHHWKLSAKANSPRDHYEKKRLLICFVSSLISSEIAFLKPCQCGRNPVPPRSVFCT